MSRLVASSRWKYEASSEPGAASAAAGFERAGIFATVLVRVVAVRERAPCAGAAALAMCRRSEPAGFVGAPDRVAATVEARAASVAAAARRSRPRASPMT